MIRSPYRRCYALIFVAFIFAAGCCCKNYDEPYTVPARTPVSSLHAGVAKIDITPAIGVPLAGWSERHRIFPDLNPFNYHTFLKPSEGILDQNRPLWAKSLVIDNGSERVCIVTLDVVASDGEVFELAHRKAAAQGFSIPIEKVLFCASHTHSGPGAMTNKRLWAYTGADLCVDRVREEFTRKIADSMVKAEQDMVPVLIGTGTSSVEGITKNRRGGVSGNFNEFWVDTQLGIIRIDKVADGTSLAIVWNFAIHGTIHRGDNLLYSPDIMGDVSALVEDPVGGVGGIALFINGSEGDAIPKIPIGNLSPADSIAHIKTTLRDAIKNTRESITPHMHSWVKLKTAYEIVDFGTPQLDATGPRLYNTISGELDIFAFMEQFGINPGATFTMSSCWTENEFRFQAIRIDKTLLSSVPGEPIYDIGKVIREDAEGMGYNKVFICALANNHMLYVTSSREYDVGYYAALLTLFGPTTGQRVREACKRVAENIRP